MVSLGIFSVATDGSMCPGVDSASKNEFQDTPGVKDGRKGDDLTNFIVSKVMKNSEALIFRIPKGLLRPVAGKLYLFTLN